MNQPDDIVDNGTVAVRQRHQAMVLGLCLGAACLALMVACIVIFSSTGLPKDPKEWKRLQEQRSAAAADHLEPPQPQKDQTR